MKKADIKVGETYAITWSTHQEPAQGRITAVGSRVFGNWQFTRGRQRFKSLPKDCCEFENIHVDARREDRGQSYELKEKGKATIWIAPNRHIQMT